MKSYFLPSLFFAALPVLAQLPTPNAAGVSAGHDIFNVKDRDAALKFWSTLGMEPAALGTIQLLKFPGVLFMASARNGVGGTEGSTIDDLGFKVKNLKESLAKWDAAGVKPLPGGTAKEVYLMGPDDIRVRITEDKSITTAIAADGPKMVVPNVAEAAAWYAKYFGAKVVKQGKDTVAEIPGSNILFVESKGTIAPTKGRALDHLGFEVANLEDFLKKLDGSGAKFDGQIRAAKGIALSISMMTDPWGTYIELSQGLSAVK